MDAVEYSHSRSAMEKVCTELIDRYFSFFNSSNLLSGTITVEVVHNIN